MVAPARDIGTAAEFPRWNDMDLITRCVHCGQRLVPFPGEDGRTQLECMWCDKLDTGEIERRPNVQLSKPGTIQKNIQRN